MTQNLLIGMLISALVVSDPPSSKVLGEELANERETVESKTIIEIEGWASHAYFPGRDQHELCDAIEKGDLGEIERGAAGGLDLNAAGKDGMNFLMWAYAAGRLEAFEKLLKLGANPNQPMQISLTAKQFRFSRPRPGDCITLVIFGEASEPWRKAVIANRGDLNVVNESERVSLLAAAAGRDNELDETIAMILAHDCKNLNYQDRFGNTVAMGLIIRGEYRSAARVLEAGASADCYNNDGEQLIDKIAARWVSTRELWEESPAYKAIWANSVSRPGFEKLVFILSERGFDLQTAMLGVSRRDTMIDGLPYYKWRRKKRGHENVPCPGLDKARDDRPDQQPDPAGQ